MTPTRPPLPSTRAGRGLALATGTMVVSGVAVFVNGDAVGQFPDATTYTTAKNLVAGIVLALIAATTLRRSHVDAALATTRRRVGLAVVAVLGGAVPFVAFFEGLARVSSTDAAFIHKTLVAWVAIGAVALLGERFTPWHLAAIALVLWGQAELAGGVGWPAWGSGELLILAATWCWAVEVVVTKRLLVHVAPGLVGAVRMAGGSVVLVGWAIARGALDDLIGLGAGQVGWAVVTGLILTAYVTTWHHALARAGAIDVSAVLVGGAVITAVLNGAVRGLELSPLLWGLALVGAGVACILVGAARSRTLAAPAPGPTAVHP